MGRTAIQNNAFRYIKDCVTFDFAAERSLPGGTITGTYCVSLILEPPVRTFWQILRTQERV